ncbi:MAG: hypothetical protein Q8N13_10950 [Acidovorax sp.]|nr:hypothetical protein [Acidovorax sp.]
MSQECLQHPEVATKMTDMPYLVRRVLRIIARHQVIKAIELEIEADLDHGISTETSLLIMRRLIDRNQDGTYSITPAGAQCVADSK